MLTSNQQPRSLKRPRKNYDDAPPIEAIHQPIDHIFIADGIPSLKKPIKKPPLSCAECRRLKLKCDRSFPCTSCKKRGCSQICPDGVLVSGKGTRFILANTEQLHQKISQMGDRIRQLEEALAQFQANHELLHPDFLTVKSAIELYGASNEAAMVDRPSTSQESKADMESDYSGGHRADQTASESDTLGSPRPSSSSATLHSAGTSPHDNGAADLPQDILDLSNSFPMAEGLDATLNSQSAASINLKRRLGIRSRLPSRETAQYFWAQAEENALWQYNPHPNHTFWPNLLHHVYDSDPEYLCPRRLALLLIILAVGCLVDLQRPSDSPEAETYHQLARAALSEVPVMEEPNVEAITCLFYMTWYLLVFSDQKKAAGYAWGLMGLTAKLAQGIDLHRDNLKGGKVIPEELDKRRSLFWELLYLDARLALSLGRPPSLFLKHMDCQRPSSAHTFTDGSDYSLRYYQEWKHSCYVECLSPVLEMISSPGLEYSKVLELDSKIREFSTPAPFNSDVLKSRPFVMQKASLATALEAVLLQLHRTWFQRALSGTEEVANRRHRYAPSVVAVFLSASRMIATVENLYRREPALSSRIYWLWSNAVSAAVALCVLVSRAPFTCLSPAALHELDRARALFTDAKESCPRALHILPMLETMVQKAHTIYTRWADGQSTTLALKPHDDSVDIPAPQIHKTKEDYAQAFINVKPERDAFDDAHPALAQCIHEVHQRALILVPLRKPCMCAAHRPAPSPTSSSWNGKPRSPLLPELYTGIMHGTPIHGLEDGQSSIRMTGPSSASRIQVVETLNFDFGVLNHQSGLMTWF